MIHHQPPNQEPSLKAQPTHQLTLLEVQVLDARSDQLRHIRSHLPELAEIATLNAAHRAISDEVRDQRIVVDDLTAAQAKADRDVEQVRARRTRDRDRMDQGLITNPKDLERMQHELESLDRRITALEDEELEVMEQVEEAQRVLDETSQKVSGTETRLADLVGTRDQRTAEIDREIADLEQRRGPLTTEIPEELLALYERLRAAQGGVGAAELRARQCGGCRLTLDHSELSRIQGLPEDQVVRCEECQRILVRTPESGL